MRGLAGKVGIVAGGGRGIGAATAKRLAAEGAHVAFLYGQYDPWSGGKFRLGRATDVADGVFGIEPNTFAVHQVVRSQQASRRSGTHSTLTRGRVRGGGKSRRQQRQVASFHGAACPSMST